MFEIQLLSKRLMGLFLLYYCYISNLHSSVFLPVLLIIISLFPDVFITIHLAVKSLFLISLLDMLLHLLLLNCDWFVYRSSKFRITMEMV